MFDAGFATRVRDPDTRWIVLERLAGLYGDDLRPVSLGEIEAAGLRLGVPIPRALKRWCQTIGNTRGVSWGQNWFLGPERWETIHDTLVVYRENQGCAEWGIPRAALEMDDPPVLVREQRAWQCQSDTFSMFTLSVALTEAALASRHTCAGSFTSEEAATRLRTALHPLGIPVLRFASADGDQFLGDGELLVFITGEFFFAAATAPASLSRIGLAAGAGGVEWTASPP